jgi:threonylcarbamoyladenosine tRNA methylthiotransferase MtaB
MSAATFRLATLGCRLNQVESDEMRAGLEAGGLELAADGAPADVCVVNTCTVTGRADQSDRQVIRRMRREHPDALLVVTGCYAQTDPEAVARIPGVDLVLGNQEKARLTELLRSHLAGPTRAAPNASVHVAPIGEARTVPATPFTRVNGRSRAFVRAQDGCQHRCAFCIVPAARGRSRSQAPDAIVAQVERLVDAGHREVTLTGVDLGHYGWDRVPRTSLAALVRRLAGVRGLRWVRLSSVLPAYFSPELVEAVADTGIVAPHLHVPLQSGSDRVLRLMRRPYTASMYRRLVERLAGATPDLGLGTDVIVGHPGETDADFAATVELVRALPLSYLHVFAYSDRRGTEAARLPDRVAPPVTAARSRVLRELGDAKSLAFRRTLAGRPLAAVVLETRDARTGLLAGLTGNYVEVLFDGPDGLARRLVTLAITDCGPRETRGRLEADAA